MKKEVFDVTAFRKGDQLEWKGAIFDIVEIGFEDAEFGFWNEDSYYKVPCEEVKYLPLENKNSDFGAVSSQMYQCNSMLNMFDIQLKEIPENLTEKEVRNLHQELGKYQGRLEILKQFEKVYSPTKNVMIDKIKKTIEAFNKTPEGDFITVDGSMTKAISDLTHLIENIK